MWWGLGYFALAWVALGLVAWVSLRGQRRERRRQRLSGQFPVHDRVTLAPSECATVNVLEQMCRSRAATRVAAERERAEQETREAA